MVGVNEKRSGWETFDHIADIGIRGWGSDLSQAFSNGAMAMFSIMVEDLSRVKPEESVDIECDSFDLTGLFVAWLNTLLAQADLHRMVFSRFQIEIDQETISLKGEAAGQIWSEIDQPRGIEVKGATFSQADVRQIDGIWMVQCILDV